MDTNQYKNILGALSPAKLSASQQSDNFKAFEEINRQGIYLPDLLRKLDDLETRIKTVESTKAPDMASEVFGAMEVSVKGDPEVRAARQRASDIKAAIISEMCLKDERYRKAVEDYRATVSRVYVAHKEIDKKEEGNPQA